MKLLIGRVHRWHETKLSVDGLPSCGGLHAVVTVITKHKCKTLTV